MQLFAFQDLFRQGYSVWCEMRDALTIIYRNVQPSSISWTYTGTLADGYSNDGITCPFQARRVDVICHDNPVTLKYSPVLGQQANPEWTVDGPGYYSYVINAKQLFLRNGTAGSNATVDVVFFS